MFAGGRVRGQWLRSALCSGVLGVASAVAETPPGLDERAPIGPYLNNVMPPKDGAFAFPPLLSATGALSDFRTHAPAIGFVPFTVNSPLWSDGTIKTRWIAVPNDGPPYDANEQIGFAPVGEWTFPNGTVFMKHFELTVNEATSERKRLETRLLVRNSEGGVYGVTYKWRADNSEADLLPGGLEEDVPITGFDGATRLQRYSYPSRADCLFCHNQQANYILGPKTHQLNGEFTYPSTGRTDHQLRTLTHLGMLNPAPSDQTFASYLRSVSVASTSAPVQHRMRSWIDANCSHCHRPGGFGPGYDGRFYTPLENQNLINTYVRFRDLTGSQLHDRDNRLDNLKMPPVAKNVVHQTAMATLRQWIASPLEVVAVYLQQDATHLAVRFNSHVDPQSAALAANYSFDQGATVTAADLSPEPDTVILTVASVAPNQSYTLTTNNVRDTAASANTIWPFSRTAFVAQFAPAPADRRLANISARVQVGTGDDVAIGGFIVRGSGSKRLLIRAVGPTLAASGVERVLADPVLELHDGTGKLLGSNDDWSDNANQQEIIDTGLAAVAAKEAVILTKLPASASGVGYTAVLRGANNATGIGLVDIYDLDRGQGPEIRNLSTRGRVGLAENVLIGGFIVGGQEAQRVMVRAIGSSLPLEGRLEDPALELYNSQGTQIATNDNWRSHQEAEIAATTMSPPDDAESAIVATLPPAAYTAIVRGANATTGLGLVEVFDLQ